MKRLYMQCGLPKGSKARGQCTTARQLHRPGDARERCGIKVKNQVTNELYPGERLFVARATKIYTIAQVHRRYKIF